MQWHSKEIRNFPGTPAKQDWIFDVGLVTTAKQKNPSAVRRRGSSKTVAEKAY
jgi:hypothetical protein